MFTPTIIVVCGAERDFVILEFSSRNLPPYSRDKMQMFSSNTLESTFIASLSLLFSLYTIAFFWTNLKINYLLISEVFSPVVQSWNQLGLVEKMEGREREEEGEEVDSQDCKEPNW